MDPLREVKAALAEGRDQDAIALLRVAADAGQQDAQFALALALAEGRIVARDNVEALSWLILTSADSLPDYLASKVRTARQKLEAALTAEDRKQATAMAEQRHHDRAEKMISQILYPISGGQDRLRVDGCAVPTGRSDCHATARELAPGMPTCSRAFPLPDVAATVRGSRAEQASLGNAWKKYVRAGESRTTAYVAHVDRSGYVCRVAIRSSSGLLELDSVILGKVATWRFQPAMKDGQPVESVLEMAVSLKIE